MEIEPEEGAGRGQRRGYRWRGGERFKPETYRDLSRHYELIVFMELTGPRRRCLEIALDANALPKLTDFLREFTSKTGWNAASTERVILVGEETLASLLSEQGDAPERAKARRLVVNARADGRGAELEFVSGAEGENLEDRLVYLGETPDIADGREISFRLLRHYASSVHHQKYHVEDVVPVRVENPR